MRWPVGKGTTADFQKYWYIASKFGVYRSVGNYYHSGDDINLKTYGDTDLGQPLYAIADGEITGIDTVSTTGFGKQIFLKFLAGGKTYWAMYAHCHSVNVKTGDKVKEGQKIGLLGKTGTTSAHLHFSIKNKANGMDNVPNTPAELKEWENPTAFIEKYMKETPKPTPSKPLKDTVIDFDDAEGKRHTVGFYAYEWFVEKQRALKAEKELDEVRAKDSEVISGLNKKIRESNAEKEGLIEPTVKNAIQILLSFVGGK